MKRILYQSNPDINSNAAKNKQRIHCLRQKWHNEKTRIAFAFGVCVWMSLLGMEKKVMGVHITCTSTSITDALAQVRKIETTGDIFERFKTSMTQSINSQPNKFW